MKPTTVLDSPSEPYTLSVQGGTVGKSEVENRHVLLEYVSAAACLSVLPNSMSAKYIHLPSSIHHIFISYLSVSVMFCGGYIHIFSNFK